MSSKAPKPLKPIVFTPDDSSSTYLARIEDGKPDLKGLSDRGLLFRNLEECRHAELPKLLWGYWLARQRVHLQVGSSTIRKTTFNYALHLALQRGMPFLDVKGKPSNVLYFDMESDDGGIKSRGNLIGVDWDRTQFEHFKYSNCNIAGGDFFDTIPYIERDLLGHGWKPDIIYLDSVSAIFEVADKDNIMAAQVMGKLRDMAQSMNVGVVLVHHPSKVERKSHDVYTGRGASNWGNLADSIWNFYSLGEGFDKNKFILNIPKSRFADDEFYQCIQADMGEFTACDLPEGYISEQSDPNALGGVDNYKKSLQIRRWALTVIGEELSAQEIMEACGIDYNSEFYRAMKPLLQIGIAKKVSRGIYTFEDSENDPEDSENEDG